MLQAARAAAASAIGHRASGSVLTPSVVGRMLAASRHEYMASVHGSAGSAPAHTAFAPRLEAPHVPVALGRAHWWPRVSTRRRRWGTSGGAERTKSSLLSAF